MTNIFRVVTSTALCLEKWHKVTNCQHSIIQFCWII